MAEAKSRDPVEVHPIDTMRAELCFTRLPLLAHEECMQWLVDNCNGKYKGASVCGRLQDHVKEHCIDGDEDACDYARQLGMNPDGWNKKGAIKGVDANEEDDEIIEEEDHNDKDAGRESGSAGHGG